MKTAYDTLSQAIEDLNKEGYTEDFNLLDRGIEVKAMKVNYDPENFNIVKTYRFEGMTNPGDSSILYVIETNNGIKGTLVDAYGAYADTMSKEMVEKLSTNN